MTTPGPVFLIGGSTPQLTREIGARALATIGRRPPTIAATYAPMGGTPDGIRYMNQTVSTMFPGHRIERLAIPGEDGATDAHTARAITQAADIIFVSGGDTTLGANLLRASGADRWLRDAHARGAALVGVSAGSIILGAWWAEWPEVDDEAAPHGGATLVACSSVLPDFVFDAHAEDDDWAELRTVSRLVQARGEKARSIGLPAGGAVVARSDGSLETVGAPPFVLEALR